jgi:hypothetical protein
MLNCRARRRRARSGAGKRLTIRMRARPDPHLLGRCSLTHRRWSAAWVCASRTMWEGSKLDLPISTVRRLRGTRHQFREDLPELERQAQGGLDMVIQSLDRALESLTYQDVELTGMVIADDDRIDGRYLEVHQGLLSLLARQAPVAGDLRIVAALLHMIRSIERMGDQCVNIAKLVVLSGYEQPKDKDILDAIQRMGQLTRSW